MNKETLKKVLTFACMMKKRKEMILEKVLFTSVASKGKSIGRVENKVVFACGVVPGDIADIRIVKKRKAYYEGTPTHFHTYSPKRTTPKCTHFGTCGGCKWQNMQYHHQLAYKQEEVQRNLVRLGNIDIPNMQPIIGAPQQYYYRNKIEFSFTNNRWLTKEEINSHREISHRNGLGFHISGKWDKILDLKKCYLQSEPSNTIRLEVKKYALQNRISFFNPINKVGLLRSMMIRISSTAQVMVLLQFYYEDTPKRESLLNHLKNTFPQISSLLYVINEKDNDSIYDQEVKTFSGNSYIWEEMEGFKFKISAQSFYQTNSEQAYTLYKVIRDLAQLTGKEVVYDLYTGTGTIAQFVSTKAKKVVGIESVAQAIEDAQENAKVNQIKNTVFYTGDMKAIFNDQFILENGTPDVIITDPPRDGMHKKVVKQILQIAPYRIVYVSCNSATQARDIALMNLTYKVVSVQAIDMFPHTHHIENIVLLEKRKP